MVDYILLRSQLRQYEKLIDELEQALHIAQLNDQYQELSQRAQEPDFWNEAEKAQLVQTKMNRMLKKIEGFHKLQTRYEDMFLLLEMAEETDDEETYLEVESEFDSFKKDYEAMRLATLLDGEHDSKNAILSLHAGAGGTEAMDWASMLFRMYSRWAENNDFTLEVSDFLDGEEAGLKSISFIIKGDNAYGYLRGEMGVHRLVRISPFDSSGRRHTSFASLEVIPELDDSIQVDIKPDDLRIDTYRSSGAGGQHVNKTSSAVRITHLPTNIVVACQNERSQIQNRETAMKQLKSKLYALARSKHMDKIDDLKGDQMEIAWGSQIRSYVFQPYQMVKDHRSNYEDGDVDAVMDGDIDGFITAYLSMPKEGKEL